MRVGISLLTLAPGDLGGSETYARWLTRCLATMGTHDYTAFVPMHTTDAGAQLPSVSVRGVGIARRGPPRIPAMRISAALSRTLREVLRTMDVVHYPLTVPIPRTRAPKVVTLHDLLHLDLPELVSTSRRRFRRHAYDRTAKAADAVIVASDYVRFRAFERLGLEESRVHVIPFGVDHVLFRPGDDTRQPFLFYPARPWPHKNHARLFEAFVVLRRELPELRLVLTGGGLEKLGPLPEGVERLGLVTTGELVSLYRTAACLVFPSRYEGFGLPPLEAMACGCPVAASRAGAIPEVCGDAAVYFDPDDPEAIANAVRETLALADELRELGLARAAGFTWEETTRRHEAVYVAAAATEAPAGTPTKP